MLWCFHIQNMILYTTLQYTSLYMTMHAQAHTCIRQCIYVHGCSYMYNKCHSSVFIYFLYCTKLKEILINSFPSLARYEFQICVTQNNNKEMIIVIVQMEFNKTFLPFKSTLHIFSTLQHTIYWYQVSVFVIKHTKLMQNHIHIRKQQISSPIVVDILFNAYTFQICTQSKACMECQYLTL